MRAPCPVCGQEVIPSANGLQRHLPYCGDRQWADPLTVVEPDPEPDDWRIGEGFHPTIWEGLPRSRWDEPGRPVVAALAILAALAVIVGGLVWWLR